MSSTSLTDLAHTILKNASELEAYFNATNQPAPTFNEHYPPELPLSEDMQSVRSLIVDTCLELHDLVVGPAMLLRPTLNGTALQFIYKYDIAAKVPLDGKASFLSIAESCNLEEADVRRMIRFAMIHHRCFQEKEPGVISHTAASRYLAESPDAKACLGFQFDECYQSFAHTVDALQKYRSPDMNQCGWALAFNSNVPMWDYHAMHPEIGERAARAMAAFTKGFNHDVSSLVDGYDWSSISSRHGLLVDVGGATGHAGILIARSNPQLHCLIQDLPGVVAKFEHDIPKDVSDRVTFRVHDFFEPQPSSADAYLFRQIFHDWPDNYCVKILRALIPALKPGAKVIANDFIVPPPGNLKPMQERQIRAMDMAVMSLFNSREREERDWQKLFETADRRFQNVKLWKPDNAYLALIEATWSG